MVKRLNQHIGKKGTAAVEFAIVLPFLVLLIFGTIEVGLMIYNNQVITNASREGARVGIVQWKHVDDTLYSDSEVRSLINTTIQNYVNARLITFGIDNPPTVSSTWASRDFGQDITVQVSYIYTYLTPSILGLGTTKTLRSRTLMKMEQLSS